MIMIMIMIPGSLLESSRRVTAVSIDLQQEAADIAAAVHPAKLFGEEALITPLKSGEVGLPPGDKLGRPSS